MKDIISLPLKKEVDIISFLKGICMNIRCPPNTQIYSKNFTLKLFGIYLVCECCREAIDTRKGIQSNYC
jgi:hypothetical protein